MISKDFASDICFAHMSFDLTNFLDQMPKIACKYAEDSFEIFEDEISLVVVEMIMTYSVKIEQSMLDEQFALFSFHTTSLSTLYYLTIDKRKPFPWILILPDSTHFLRIGKKIRIEINMKQ